MDQSGCNRRGNVRLQPVQRQRQDRAIPTIFEKPGPQIAERLSGVHHRHGQSAAIGLVGLGQFACNIRDPGLRVSLGQEQVGIG